MKRLHQTDPDDPSRCPHPVRLVAAEADSFGVTSSDQVKRGRAVTRVLRRLFHGKTQTTVEPRVTAIDAMDCTEAAVLEAMIDASNGRTVSGPLADAFTTSDRGVPAMVISREAHLSLQAIQSAARRAGR